MLEFYDAGGRCGRRTFLKVGGLALGGLGLPGLLAARARAAEGRRLLTDRSVIFLFLHGGPSQAETFDPKMSAPAGVRSATGEVATRLPGVTFGGTFPKLAALADRVTVVRSFVPGDAGHNLKPLVCPDTFGANFGAAYARVAGVNHPATGMPTNVVLFPRAVDPSTQAATTAFGKFNATGPFGSACEPFDPSGGGQLQKDMRLATAPGQPTQGLLPRGRYRGGVLRGTGRDHRPPPPFGPTVGGGAEPVHRDGLRGRRAAADVLAERPAGCQGQAEAEAVQLPDLPGVPRRREARRGRPLRPVHRLLGLRGGRAVGGHAAKGVGPAGPQRRR